MVPRVGKGTVFLSIMYLDHDVASLDVGHNVKKAYPSGRSKETTHQIHDIPERVASIFTAPKPQQTKWQQFLEK